MPAKPFRQPCPKCGKREFVLALDRPGPADPEPGQFLVCTGCSLIVRLQPDMSITAASAEDIESAPEEARRCIRQINEMLPTYAVAKAFASREPQREILRPPGAELVERIDTVYAYVVKDVNGEGIPATLNSLGVMQPLISSQLENIKQARRAAQQISNDMSKTLVLCKFSGREELETITPQQRFTASNES